MTDRIHSLTVVLDKDMREDDVQAVANAIRMLRPVIDVHLNVADPVSVMAESRAKFDLRKKLAELAT